MGIFNLDLQTEVRPMDTPVNQSTSTAIGGLANFVTAMGNRKGAMDEAADAAARAAKAAEPTYTQVKDQQEQANLASFTSGLADLAQMRDSKQISLADYNIKEKAFLTSFAAQGIDISAGAYDAAYTVTTGRPSNAMGLSDTDIAINQLSQTPEGLGKLSLANYTLTQTLGREPTRDEVAAQIQADMAVKTTYDNTVIKNQADLQQKLPILQDQVSSVAKNFNDALGVLETSGVDLTPEMLQKTYVQYKAFKTEALAKLPADTPQEVKNDLFRLTDEFFTAQGMEQTNGVFKIESTDALQLKYKAQLIVKALKERGKPADDLLALGIIKNGYSINPQDQPAIDTALGNMDLTPSTPDWVTEAGIVLSNDLISTAQAITAPDTVFLRDAKGYQTAFKEAIGQEAYDLNSKQTASEGWSNFTSRSTIMKGFNQKDILDGVADPASVYTQVAGLATALGTVDFTNEAASFDGVRSSVTSNILPIIDALEKVDPEKGKAARTLMFYSLGKAASEYDAQIKAEEKALSLNFNPKSGTYELDLNAALSGLPKEEADNRIAFIKLLNTKYNGDIVKAVADDFKSMAYANLTEEEKRTMKPQSGRGAGQGYVPTDLIKDFTPDRAMRLLDLRNSRVYLDSVAGQIEPADIKERRMNTPAKLAEATMSTLAATEGTVTAGGITTSPIAPMSTTATLLDKFEGGGDYNALLGFANREGGPLAGTKVSEMTIGQLKNFADTTYSNYSTKELGYKATPMGRYQFVGTTLADVASRMGLPDNTVFTPEVQDKMFTFHAKEVIAGKEPAGKRGALRSTWEGLRNASDAELDAMIAEIESGEASFATTGPTQGTKFQGVTPSTRNVTPPIAVQAQGEGATAASTSTATPTQPIPEQAPTASPTLPEDVQGQQTTEGKTAANTPIDQKVMDTIKMLAANPNDVRIFATQDELIQAYNNQELRLGSLVVINGEVKAVTQDMVGAK
jgi:hypothetical protein